MSFLLRSLSTPLSRYVSRCASCSPVPPPPRFLLLGAHRNVRSFDARPRAHRLRRWMRLAPCDCLLDRRPASARSAILGSRMALGLPTLSHPSSPSGRRTSVGRRPASAHRRTPLASDGLHWLPLASADLRRPPQASAHRRTPLASTLAGPCRNALNPVCLRQPLPTSAEPRRPPPAIRRLADPGRSRSLGRSVVRRPSSGLPSVVRRSSAVVGP